MSVEACAVTGCSRARHTRGWCKPHYDAFLRTCDPGSYARDRRAGMSPWEKVLEIGFTRSATGCLEYNGYRNELGYGQFRDGRGPLLRVHRLAYENLIGPLSKDMEVLHSCDNPSCSEPAHLRAGTHAENMRDMCERKRHWQADWTSCPNGHPYPPERPPASTRNRCAICARERNRRYYQRKNEVHHGVAN